jgi:hypothetical protein
MSFPAERDIQRSLVTSEPDDLGGGLNCEPEHEQRGISAMESSAQASSL